MSKPNFSQMTLQELRSYVLQNRDDEDAIYALVLHVEQNGKRLNSIEELEQIIEEKRRQGREP